MNWDNLPSTSLVPQPFGVQHIYEPASIILFSSKSSLQTAVTWSCEYCKINKIKTCQNTNRLFPERKRVTHFKCSDQAVTTMGMIFCTVRLFARVTYLCDLLTSGTDHWGHPTLWPLCHVTPRIISCHPMRRPDRWLVYWKWKHNTKYADFI